jgi:hypothetical protein
MNSPDNPLLLISWTWQWVDIWWTCHTLYPKTIAPAVPVRQTPWCWRLLRHPALALEGVIRKVTVAHLECQQVLASRIYYDPDSCRWLALR